MKDEQNLLNPPPLLFSSGLLLNQRLASLPPRPLMLPLGFDEVLDPGGEIGVLGCEVHYVF